MAVSIVGGVPGVGSTRVCELARQDLGDEFELLNYGDVMLEEAMAREHVATRDDLGDLPIGELHDLQRQAAVYIGERAREGDLLVDTHFVLHTAHGFIPGLPEAVLQEVHPDLLILVEATPEAIVQRRERSQHREYHVETARTVEFHQQLNRSAAVTYSMHTDAPIRIVSNQAEAEDAAATLTRMLEGMTGG